ncbi:dicarboxylate/amino acid:cation symporter [Hydrogenimonas thermophila]|uniref:dicarboxylate/amino acid:cation symporter n=1 Tax=Hydrogenimonas thermophila TaxID=223786 RepID=UPI00293707CD|nr:dicarboxylate/amino acid:cation symporter [Hydrogenimonas thermophila]WOE69519.1 dicarboxylate/amino acid:cation symporter [Hydrogenimonas thermophila]WOE72030.1 dicarboxylate/amino acid:cation symporter [Hydrogenimonas thermophila]
MKLSTETLTIVAIFLGIAAGVYLPELMLSLKWIGDLFLMLLKMLIVPLVFASLFVAIVSLGSGEALKNLGLKAFGYYFLTTALAVTTGLVVVNIIEPGSAHQMAAAAEVTKPAEHTFASLLLSFVPSNIFASLSEGKIVQVLLFVIFFAIATLHLESTKRDSLHNFFDAINDAMGKIAEWIIKLTPLGVFSLIGYVIAKEGIETLWELKSYVAAVLIALFIHAIIVLPTVASFIGRFNPFGYFKRVREAVLVAFSTASSSATLPVSIEVASTRGGVKKESAGFILPLGATVNMDGTALYEAIAVMFIANSYGVELGFSQQIVIFLTATFASIGAAGIPGAGLVMMTMILSAVGLPLEAIGLIAAVDRILDMFRTAINVWGDLLAAKVLNRFVY